MSQTDTDAPPAADASEPIFLSETVQRMGRRRTRVLALASLIVAAVATLVVLSTLLAPKPVAPIAEATEDAWSAVAALSDGLREVGPATDLASLGDEAKGAREALQAAGARVKTQELPVSQTPLRRRVIRTLRADDAWVRAVEATLRDPQGPRRAELAGLAKEAAATTTLIAGDLEDAGGSIGGTGRLLSATRRGR